MPELGQVSLAHPLAIVGQEDVVLGFSALGFKVYPAKGPEDFRAILSEIIQAKVGLCLVQDNLYLAFKEEIASYRHLTWPIFIPFSKTLPTDLLEDLIKKIRLKAQGVF